VTNPFITNVAESTPFEPNRNPDTNGQVGTIDRDETQSAIEFVFNNAPGKLARFTLTLLNNGTLSNGQRITYSELLPNAQIIVPKRSRLKEAVFDNSRSNADWEIDFYRYTKASNYTSGTLIYTWSPGDNTKNAVIARNDLFEAQDEIRCIYRDIGRNASDASLILYFVNDDYV